WWDSSATGLSMTASTRSVKRRLKRWGCPGARHDVGSDPRLGVEHFGWATQSNQGRGRDLDLLAGRKNLGWAVQLLQGYDRGEEVSLTRLGDHPRRPAEDRFRRAFGSRRESADLRAILCRRRKERAGIRPEKVGPFRRQR